MHYYFTVYFTFQCYIFFVLAPFEADSISVIRYVEIHFHF